jgi:hypothetical protein
MIWDSSFWKDDLLILAQDLLRVTKRRKPSQRLLVNLEKKVFLAGYTIRKLMEAGKLSSETEALPVPVVSYRNLGKAVTIINWHRLDGLYDFKSGRPISLPLRVVCNQIIHSYVFMPGGDSATGPVNKIWFCSGRSRNRCLYELALSDLAEVLSVVGHDYPAQAVYVYDPAQKDYRVRAWTPGRRVRD